MMRTLKLFGLGAVLVLWALATGGQGQIGLGEVQEQLPCTVTVTPGQSIQEAINKANPGDVICLSEGEWHENLVIKKGLTLRGAGREQSVIKGKEEGKPAVRIKSESRIEVTIEGLTIAEAKSSVVASGVDEISLAGGAGILAGGKAIMIVRNSEISGNDLWGIKIGGSSQATISGSEISEGI